MELKTENKVLTFKNKVDITACVQDLSDYKEFLIRKTIITDTVDASGSKDACQVRTQGMELDAPDRLFMEFNFKKYNEFELSRIVVKNYE